MEKKNIIFNHTLEEYKQKYKYSKLKKIRKIEADNTPELLGNKTWWFIDEVYYEIPKAPSYHWFRNLNKTVQIVTCCLLGVAVVTAIVVPTTIVLTRNDNLQKVVISEEKADFAIISKIETDKESNNIITVTSRDTRKHIDSVIIQKGNLVLVKDKDYTTSALPDGILIKLFKSACQLNNDKVVIIPELSESPFLILNKSELTLPLGSIEILIAKVNPEGAIVKWMSNDTNIATVDQTGKVTPIAIGNALITAYTETGLYASCIVNVVSKPVRIMKAYARTQNFDIENSTGYQIVCLEGEKVLEGNDLTYEFRKNGFLCENILTITSDGRIKCINHCEEGGEVEITVKKPQFNDAKLNVSVGSYGKLSFKLDPLKLEGSVKAADIVGETSNSLVIPTCYYNSDGNKYKINKIEDHAFQNSALTSVYIPNTIETIGDYSFSQCGTGVSLTRVVFESNSNLKTIGSHAFTYLENLKYLTIPKSVTNIGTKAFGENSTKLLKIFIDSPYAANLIENNSETNTGLFEYANNVEINKDINLDPNSFVAKNYIKGETTGNYVDYVQKITRYTKFKLLSANTCDVSSISETADRTPLEITIPEKVDGSMVQGGTSGTNYTITEIPNYAFNKALITYYHTITIPTGVTKIGYEAFKDDTSTGTAHSIYNVIFEDKTSTWTIYRKRIEPSLQPEEATPVETTYNPATDISKTITYLTRKVTNDGWDIYVDTYRWVKNQ